jgi:hypothetical protein
MCIGFSLSALLFNVPGAYRTGVSVSHCFASYNRVNTLEGLLGSTFCLRSTAMSSDSGDIPTTIATGPTRPSAPNSVSAAATALTSFPWISNAACVRSKSFRGRSRRVNQSPATNPRLTATP